MSEILHCVYVLMCPDTGRVKYVGVSKNVDKRYLQHCLLSNNVSNTKRCNWLRKVINEGKKPTILVIQEGITDWDAAERIWVKFYRDRGYELANGNDGGIQTEHMQRAVTSNKLTGKRTKLATHLSYLKRMLTSHERWRDQNKRPKGMGFRFSSEERYLNAKRQLEYINEMIRQMKRKGTYREYSDRYEQNGTV